MTPREITPVYMYRYNIFSIQSHDPACPTCVCLFSIYFWFSEDHTDTTNNISKFQIGMILY